MAIFDAFKSKAKVKHAIIEVIEYSGANDVLIWKHPNENFNTNTQLIVGPSQEAILVKGGQVMGRFPSGTHTLDSKNYPFLRALIGLGTGGVSPFQCAVYYVNKVISMGIDWGTDSPIRMTDPVYQVPIDIRSYGDFSVQVNNAQKLLEKLVGSTEGFSTENLQSYFCNLLAVQLRGLISGIMVQESLSPVGIDVHLGRMSDAARKLAARVLEPYGLDVVHFTIANISYSGLEEIEAQLAEETRANISFQHETQRHRISTDIEAEDTVKQGRATAEANRELGFSAKEQAGMDVAKALAGNPGPMMGSGGMGFPGGIIGGNIVQPSASGTVDLVRSIIGTPAPTEPAPVADSGGIMPGNGSFGMMEEAEAFTDNASSGADDAFKTRIDKLKYMLDTGAITQEKYDAAVEKILSEI